MSIWFWTSKVSKTYKWWPREERAERGKLRYLRPAFGDPAVVIFPTAKNFKKFYIFHRWQYNHDITNLVMYLDLLIKNYNNQV